jgi:hypothetical protein
MSITGIPDYSHQTPLALFINCPWCVKRYLIWTGKEEPARVEPLGDYSFVDARAQSSIQCPCGEILPLVEILAAEGVM